MIMAETHIVTKKICASVCKGEANGKDALKILLKVYGEDLI